MIISLPLSYGDFLILKVDIANMEKYRPYFKDYFYAENLLDTMTYLNIGSLFVDDYDDPSILNYNLPYMNLLCGNPASEHLEEFLHVIPERHILMIPPNEEWEKTINSFWNQSLYTVTRTLLDPSSLTISHIRQILTDYFPSNFLVSHLDLGTVEFIDQNINNFFTTFWYSPQNFMKEGIGFCIKNGNKLASFASAFLPFKRFNKLEVQVITLPKYRRKGLASYICAKLIEFCLENDIIPCWDAANEKSVHLALKLGYSNPQKYLWYYWKKESS